MPVKGDASGSGAANLWLTRGITDDRSSHDVYVSGAWSWISTGGYRYLVRVALHVALVEAWIPTLAGEYSRLLALSS